MGSLVSPNPIPAFKPQPPMPQNGPYLERVFERIMKLKTTGLLRGKEDVDAHGGRTCRDTGRRWQSTPPGERPQEEVSPAHALIGDFPPPALRGNQRLGCKPLAACVPFPTSPRNKHTPNRGLPGGRRVIRPISQTQEPRFRKGQMPCVRSQGSQRKPRDWGLGPWAARPVRHIHGNRTQVRLRSICQEITGSLKPVKNILGPLKNILERPTQSLRHLLSL